MGAGDQSGYYAIRDVKPQRRGSTHFGSVDAAVSFKANDKQNIEGGFMKVMYLLLGACSVIVPVSATAQVAVTPAETAERPRQAYPPDIVVTATKRETKIFDVSGTLSAVSGDALQRQAGNSLSDITSMVSGVTFGGLNVKGQIAIRGVSTTSAVAGLAQPNAIYVDGIYNTDAGVLRNNYGDIERVEVLKGPQGTLFGRNATGGALQVITRNPTFDWSADVDIDLSYFTGASTSASSPHLNPNIFISGPIAPGLLAFSVAGSYNYIQGYNYNDGTGGRGGRQRDSYLRGKLLLTPSDSLKIVVSGYRIRNDDQRAILPYLRPVNSTSAPYIYSGYNSASFFPGTIIASKAWHIATADNFDPNADKILFKQTGFTARADMTLGIGTLTSLTGYTKTDNIQPDNVSAARPTLDCTLAFGCFSSNYFGITKEFSQEFDFASKKFGIFSLVAGLNYFHSTATTSSTLLFPGNPPVPILPLASYKIRTNAYAAFGELTVQPVDRLSVILGLRYNHEPHHDTDILVFPNVDRKKTYNSYTPKIAMKYSISDYVNAYASVSEGRTAGLTGITNSLSPLGKYSPVYEEKLRSYEIGLKYKSSHLSGNLSFFYYDYSEKQESVNSFQNYTFNTGPVRIYGVDADASLRVTSDLTLTLAGTYIPYAKYRDFPNADSGTGIPFDATGFRLVRSPKLTANATVAYKSGAFDASTTFSYSSKFFLGLDNLVYQPSYLKINANIGYSLNESVRVGIFGRNLTNKKIYNAFILSAPALYTSLQPPQEVGVTLGFKY